MDLKHVGNAGKGIENGQKGGVINRRKNDKM
jgi:hypothetical protein